MWRLLVLGALVACSDSATTSTTPPARAEGALGERAIRAIIDNPPPEQWFGVYLPGSKIGHAWVALRKDAEGIVVSSAMSITMAQGGGLKVTKRAVYASEAPYPLIGLRELEITADGRNEMTATRRGELFELRTRQDDSAPRGRTVRASAETFASAALTFAPSSVLRSGDRFEYFEFDMSSGADRAVTTEVTGVEVRRVMGVQTSLVALRERSSADGATTSIVLSGRGRTLRVEYGAFALRAEERQRAVSDVVGYDYAMTSVKVDRPLGDPAGVETLTLEVRSRADFTIPSAVNQKVSGQRVEITAAPGGVVSASERASYTTPSMTVDADNPAVLRAARAAVGDARTDAERVVRLSRWVHSTLEQDVGVDIPVASAVLARKRGDCTEHALLVIAMARALGMPAREVSGLIYVGDEARRFGWHAWAEIAVDGRWQRVDPTWNEPRGNATHLTLGYEGDSGWITLLGAVEIEILGVNGV